MRTATLTSNRQDFTGRSAGHGETLAKPGVLHAVILGAVWLTFALSGIVFTEPAPVDLMLMGLIFLLPAVGLVTFTPALATYLALWGIVGAAGLLAATMSRDVAAATIFTLISLYLYVASAVLAAFIARAPERHTELIFSAMMVAALIAAAAGLTGYFKLVPGAFELFTKYERASGTFKDPNVFGPFLVPPFLYGLHLVLNRPWSRAVWPLMLSGFLALAILFSYSRGAWANLGLALVIYGFLAHVTASADNQRRKISSLLLAGIIVIAMVTAAVLQDEKIASFLADRASLTQSYDVGPAGRFGGQEKAIRLILENPLGIGATQFASVYHHEEVHNVFLSMFLNAGWLGGLMYALIVLLTLVAGFQHLMRGTPSRPLFLIAFAAFIATALEGIIIDSDHWRIFYVLMAIVWGHVASPHHARSSQT